MIVSQKRLGDRMEETRLVIEEWPKDGIVDKVLLTENLRPKGLPRRPVKQAIEALYHVGITVDALLLFILRYLG